MCIKLSILNPVCLHHSSCLEKESANHEDMGAVEAIGRYVFVSWPFAPTTINGLNGADVQSLVA